MSPVGFVSHICTFLQGATLFCCKRCRNSRACFNFPAPNYSRFLEANMHEFKRIRERERETACYLCTPANVSRNRYCFILDGAHLFIWIKSLSAIVSNKVSYELELPLNAERISVSSVNRRLISSERVHYRVFFFLRSDYRRRGDFVGIRTAVANLPSASKKQQQQHRRCLACNIVLFSSSLL